MDNFISEENKNKLINGSFKLLLERFNITIDKNDLNNVIINFMKLIKEKYNNECDYDLKTLNNICLTNVKKYYTEEKSEEKSEEPLLQNKINNLELKRKEIIDNYNNNSINTIYNNKSFIISSLNNTHSNMFNLENINLNYNTTSFKPNKLILPKYINNIMPYICLNIYIYDKILTYNFVCSFKNDIWDTWTTDDNYIFKLNNNNINYSFTDYNDNIINFDLTKINILNIDNRNQYLYLNVGKYINYFNNKEYIIIENFKKKYKKTILTIDDSNIVIKNENIDKTFFENLKTSNIILYENQFTLIMNYYNK